MLPIFLKRIRILKLWCYWQCWACLSHGPLPWEVEAESLVPEVKKLHVKCRSCDVLVKFYKVGQRNHSDHFLAIPPWVGKIMNQRKKMWVSVRDEVRGNSSRLWIDKRYTNIPQSTQLCRWQSSWITTDESIFSLSQREQGQVVPLSMEIF